LSVQALNVPEQVARAPPTPALGFFIVSLRSYVPWLTKRASRPRENGDRNSFFALIAKWGCRRGFGDLYFHYLGGFPISLVFGTFRNVWRTSPKQHLEVGILEGFRNHYHFTLSASALKSQPMPEGKEASAAVFLGIGLNDRPIVKPIIQLFSKHFEIDRFRKARLTTSLEDPRLFGSQGVCSNGNHGDFSELRSLAHPYN
jgi:hypothetical protein